MIRRPILLRAGIAAVTAALAAATAAAIVLEPPAGADEEQSAAAAPSTPPVTVSTVVDGLSFPWDLSFTPDGAALYDERPGRLWVRTAAGANRRLSADLSDLFVGSESGLEGLVVDPAFASNRRFYTCQAYKGSGTSPIDLRVIRWSVDSGYTAATRVGAPVVSGLPITSGRHGGCRLRFAADGTLHVGTGDAATGTNPQNLQSLGGKTLRVNADGSIPTDNPFYAQGGNARYVYTYGHRNVQGLALRPGTGQMWTVEHGSDRDDEVNLEQKGANYGWDPVPGYDESTPMTDLSKFPNAIPAKWSSGNPTIAPSGGTFLTGSAWGRWQGALAVGVLKDTGLLILTVDPAGSVVRTERIPQLQGDYGRIRATQLGPDNNLYVTTSNGSDDKILRIAPNPVSRGYLTGLDVSPSGVATALRADDTQAVLARSPSARPYALVRGPRTAGSWEALPFGSGRISAPAVVAGQRNRFDAFAHDDTGALLHWAFDGRTWSRPQNLGGVLTSAPAATTLGDGSINVFARGTDNALWRKRYDGSWQPWTKVGGVLTSAPGATADGVRHLVTVVVRGKSQRAYSVVLSKSGIVSDFAATGGSLWTAQSLAPTPADGSGPWGVDTSYDGSPVLTRRDFAVALVGRFSGAPAVASSPGLGPIVVGRAPSGTVYSCDLSAGHCTFASLGGRTG